MTVLIRTLPLAAGLLCLSLAATAAPQAATDLPMADGGRYSGPLVEGLRQGRGVVLWENGGRYEGDFDAGYFHGHGRMVLADGSIYEGAFQHGVMAGQGHLEMRNGSRYDGEFARGDFQGQGRFVTEGGDVFEGEFTDGTFTGSGRFQRANGERHEGHFVEWRPRGEGSYTNAGGVRFEGDFSEKGLSRGRIVTPDGSRYEGEIADWKPTGEGALWLPGGDHYTGGFTMGLYHGQGTLTYAQAQADGRRGVSGQWVYGRIADPAGEARAAADMETALYDQRRLLDEALARLQPSAPDRINLYLLAVAGDGRQEVFRREVDFVRDQFDTGFGTAGRSLALVNSRNTLVSAPMATRTSLRESLTRVASLMDKERDILFLFLTSHGSPTHELALDQRALELADLPAGELATLLRDSGIRWKVVVVSACYSGGFVEPLRDDNTLIITAARHDRSSFGCSDENDFTFFGRAFFSEALPRSNSFQEAFRRADRLVGEWEEKEAREAKCEGAACDAARSLPQMASGAAIEKQLRAWWRQQRKGRTKVADSGPQAVARASTVRGGR